jgi:hypothetical protein
VEATLEHVESLSSSVVRWTFNQPDGRTLYFVDAARQWVMAADLLEDGGSLYSAPRKIFPLPERTINAKEVAYDTLPNGEFLFGIGRREMRHRLVFNWLAEVDAKLAAANR